MQLNLPLVDIQSYDDFPNQHNVLGKHLRRSHKSNKSENLGQRQTLEVKTVDILP